jgi:hypothetical protein
MNFLRNFSSLIIDLGRKTGIKGGFKDFSLRTFLINLKLLTTIKNSYCK